MALANDTPITVVGAGILGLWQTLVLARAGFPVHLVEAEGRPFARAASSHAGAMIAPYCEAEQAPPLVRDFGLEAARLWKATYPGLARNGSLVVAAARDQAELRRFARATSGHQTLDGAALAQLEPDLDGRFSSALFFPDEAHMTTPEALRELVSLAQSAGARVSFGVCWSGEVPSGGWVVDCRGMGARSDLANLRGVRGERLVVATRAVTLKRPVRLLHPRHPLYVVPWSGHRFLVGATVIESDDPSPMTVRSALELLGLAYALAPGFGEAEIVEMGAGVRPALPDNVPRVMIEAQRRIVRVNGAFRHGFLLGPVLADVVRGYLTKGDDTHPLIAR